MPEKYQVCQALKGYQVSCVPNPDMGLAYLVEGTLEVAYVKCTILQMTRLSPETRVETKQFPLVWREEPPWDSRLLSEPGNSPTCPGDAQDVSPIGSGTLLYQGWEASFTPHGAFVVSDQVGGPVSAFVSPALFLQGEEIKNYNEINLQPSLIVFFPPEDFSSAFPLLSGRKFPF